MPAVKVTRPMTGLAARTRLKRLVAAQQDQSPMMTFSFTAVGFFPGRREGTGLSPDWHTTVLESSHVVAIFQQDLYAATSHKRCCPVLGTRGLLEGTQAWLLSHHSMKRCIRTCGIAGIIQRHMSSHKAYRLLLSKPP
jgi:hypothetical protein